MAQGGEQGTLIMGFPARGTSKGRMEGAEGITEKFGDNLGDPLEQKGFGIGIEMC